MGVKSARLTNLGNFFCDSKGITLVIWALVYSAWEKTVYLASLSLPILSYQEASQREGLAGQWWMKGNTHDRGLRSYIAPMLTSNQHEATMSALTSTRESKWFFPEGWEVGDANILSHLVVYSPNAWDSGTQSRSHMWMAGTQLPEPSRPASQHACLQKAGIRSGAGTWTRHSDEACRGPTWCLNTWPGVHFQMPAFAHSCCCQCCQVSPLAKHYTYFWVDSSSPSSMFSLSTILHV